MPSQITVHKSKDRNYLKKPAQGLLLIHGGIEATLAITMIHSAIYNSGKINPEYEKVLS